MIIFSLPRYHFKALYRISYTNLSYKMDETSESNCSFWLSDSGATKMISSVSFKHFPNYLEVNLPGYDPGKFSKWVRIHNNESHKLQSETHDFDFYVFLYIFCVLYSVIVIR